MASPFDVCSFSTPIATMPSFDFSSFLTPLFLSPSPLYPPFHFQARRAPAGHRAAPPQGQAAERGEDFDQFWRPLSRKAVFFLSLRRFALRRFVLFDRSREEAAATGDKIDRLFSAPVLFCSELDVAR